MFALAFPVDDRSSTYRLLGAKIVPGRPMGINSVTPCSVSRLVEARYVPDVGMGHALPTCSGSAAGGLAGGGSGWVPEAQVRSTGWPVGPTAHLIPSWIIDRNHFWFQLRS